MLIANATSRAGAPLAVRIDGKRVGAIATALDPEPGEQVIDARGGLLLPGLHDHHIHLMALAASFESIRVGPPDVLDRDGLAAALAAPGDGWLRATGYHESVAGMPDRAMLDALAPHRPVRVQHRSGRMWFLNSAALGRLLAGRAAPAGLDRETGRLFDEDAWLRAALAASPPSLARVGADLARRGVTGVTDMSPANDAVAAAHLGHEREAGALPQTVRVAGRLDLDPGDLAAGLTLGEAKLHLHEAALPGYDDTVDLVRAAHLRERAVAVHCTTEVELVFALAAIAEAGARDGDRIEHASIATDDAVAEIARLGLAVVSQPHFVAERGDAYRANIEAAAQPHLYRLRAFADAGVALAGGSDAPFGRPDPWASMAAAVTRRTASGMPIGAGEGLSPEAALDLYLAAPDALARTRRIELAAPADLCLLDRGWRAARERLGAVEVRATWVDGRLVHDGVDQAPLERGPGGDAAA